jgi:uroporphyrinogen-III synthase
VAVTRPADAVDGLRQAVESMGGALQPLPTLAFEPRAGLADRALPDLKAYDWLLFTSQNAVHFFSELVRELPEHLKVGAVGGHTASALEAIGWPVHLVGGGTGGGDFATEFLKRAGPGRRVLWPTGEDHRPEVQDTLLADGVSIEPWLIYRTTVPPAEARVHPDRVRPDWILVTSPAAGRNFVTMYGRPAGARWAAIGPTTQAEMQKLLGIPVTVARETSLEALAEVLV